MRASDSVSAVSISFLGLGDPLAERLVRLGHPRGCLGDQPLGLGLCFGAHPRCAVGRNAVRLVGVCLCGLEDLRGVCLGGLQHLLDSLVDVVGSHLLVRCTQLAAQRLDLCLRARELSGEVGAARRGGIPLGCGNPKVVVQSVDLTVDLLAVVTAHRTVEAPACLVQGEQVSRGFGHAGHVPRTGWQVSKEQQQRLGYIPRKRLMASTCLARSSWSETPRPSSGARQSTPTLP